MNSNESIGAQYHKKIFCRCKRYWTFEKNARWEDTKNNDQVGALVETTLRQTEEDVY